jgi:hypothetical protein
MKTYLWINAVLLWCLMDVQRAWADWGVSNLSKESSEECPPWVLSEDSALGITFNTGTLAGGYTVNRILLSIASGTVTSSGSDPSVHVQLWWADPSGHPTDYLGDFIDSQTPMMAEGTIIPGIHSFEHPGVHLPPNKMFWIFARVFGGGISVAINRTLLVSETSFPADPTAGGGWKIGNEGLEIENGLARTVRCIPYLGVFEVVPEPSSSSLLLFLALMFYGGRRLVR